MPLRAFLALFLLLAGVSPAMAASVSGKVSVVGRIEKVKFGKVKKFNPYGNLYKDDKAPAELQQDLIVYVDGLRAPDPKAKNPVLSQKAKNFSSSIVPVMQDASVEIRNDDSIRHHIRSNAKPWDFNLKPKAPGETVTRKFEGGSDTVGVVPVYCDIHSNMRAHVLVMPNPHWQLLPETGGKYSLKGLPAGTYTITAWHPTLKAQAVKVTLKAGDTKTIDLVMTGKQD
jgi:plastocyanin